MKAIEYRCIRKGCPDETIFATAGVPPVCPHCHSSAHVGRPVETPFEASRDAVAEKATFLRDYCHALSRSAGWWHDGEGNHLAENPMTFAVKLCLIHSEISEAMEGDRKGAPDDKLPHRPMREVELADALIRILDLAGAYGLDIGGALVEKLKYNASRADHRPENRRAPGGKAY